MTINNQYNEMANINDNINDGLAGSISNNMYHGQCENNQ